MTTPSAPFKERINFIDGAATPPSQGGESILHSHSFSIPTHSPFPPFSTPTHSPLPLILHSHSNVSNKMEEMIHPMRLTG